MINYKEKLSEITTLIFDFDGVLSDGKVLVLPDGEQLRMTNVRDGYALQLAIKKGLNIAIISGGRSVSMQKRFESMNLTDIYLGIDNKMETFQAYLKKKNVHAENVIYMGDDIPDYFVMKEAGLAVCPANAAEEIKAISHYISKFNGGDGCARDIIEQVLKVKNMWFDDEAFTW